MKELKDFCNTISDIKDSEDFPIYSIVYDYTDKKFDIICLPKYTICEHFFLNEEDAQNAIKELGYEKLKLIFNI